MSQTARFAETYVRRYGLHIVPLPPRTKRPIATDWGNDVITDPAEAERYFTEHPDWNIGIALGPSRLCSLDIDDMEAMRLICEEFGINLPELYATHPTIQGASKGMRIMFRVPDGVDLPYHSLTWPKRDGEKGRFTVFELRSACDGQQRQDVFPPSIHPDTGKPYIWLTRPNGAFFEPPAWLLTIWKEWANLKPQLQDACPWAERPVPTSAPAVPRQSGQPSVIDAYAASRPVTDALAAYGYKQIGKRWLSPHSSTGLPGVNVLPDGRAWIHHASDPLCSTESGRPVNSFDLFCQYEHGGDASKAVKAAAESLGMKPTPRQNPPANVDTETGEIIDPPQPARPGSVDYITWLSDVNDKGKPLATIQNVMDICERLGIIIRYNVISKEEEIVIPGAGFSLDNRQNASLSYLLSECAKFRMPTDKVPDFVTYIADQNQFNPVANWITSTSWDGEDRLSQLIATVTSAGESHAPRIGAMKRAMMTRWMISAVAAAFRPIGVSAHGVLVFQGDQYLGKTKWFKSLVPQELGVLQDGVILRPEDRDSVKQCVSNWLVELGELDATFRKSDIAALKAFLTKDKDVLRRAYARRESEFARRTVFFASVNPKEFLHDPTGNRRYWTIECEHLDYDHGIDMQQCWAQVYEQHYLAGESWFLTAGEMDSLNDHNKGFEVIDPIEELILNGLDWESPSTLWNWRSATEVLKELGRDTPTLAEATRAAHVIRMKNGRMSKKSNGARFLLVPRKI